MKYQNVWIFYSGLLQCMTVSFMSSWSKSLFSPLALKDKLICISGETLQAFADTPKRIRW